jgi:hypothetical protein
VAFCHKTHIKHKNNFLLVSELVVQQNRTSGVKYIMRNETTTGHVPPIRLWQALCGGVQLPKGQYQHVIQCVACEELATQIGDALDDIEEALKRHRIGVSGGSQSTSRLN